jgi:hypothetical protein
MHSFRSRCAAALSQPLVAFFLSGAAIFGLYGAVGRADRHREPDVIRVEAPDIRRLADGFEGIPADL